MARIVHTTRDKERGRKEGSIKEIIITDLGDALDGYNAQTTRGGTHYHRICLI